MLTLGQIVEGKIETLAFGGEGILRHEGFVIFVPFTAIGDHIRCVIKELKRSYARGECLQLLHASSLRTKPLCPYFGSCGGCQLQHLQEKAQLTYKLNTVQDAFQRIGHLSLPELEIVPATQTWTYRRHITLQLKPKDNKYEAGFIGYDHQKLIVIKTCPIFLPIDSPILQDLHSLFTQLHNPDNQEGRVIILKNEKGQVILFFQCGKEFEKNRDVLQSHLNHSPYLAGILIKTPTGLLTLGHPYCTINIETLSFQFSPQTFVQNHPEQSANIYRTICHLISSSSKKVLDLYCGFGMLSLLLAKQGHHVTGIEYNKESIHFAKENAKRNGLDRAHFIQGDVEKKLPDCLKLQHPDIAIINPPRQGLAQGVIQTLLKAKIKQLIYISCMPATLARDLALLSPLYDIKSAKAYDMFPQTAHVETVAHLMLRD